MTRWSIVVSDETDKALRLFLAQNGGKKGDLSQFVEHAVQGKLFEMTVQDVQERNAAFNQQDILNAVEEALRDAPRT